MNRDNCKFGTQTCYINQYTNKGMLMYIAMSLHPEATPLQLCLHSGDVNLHTYIVINSETACTCTKQCSEVFNCTLSLVASY